MRAMTGVVRKWAWLFGVAAMAVGVVLIVTVGAVGTCYGSIVVPDGSTMPPNPCLDSANAAQRNWILGEVLLLLGLATVAYVVGFKRGQRIGGRDSS